ncbi:MAG: redoxin domain-containing protein, partial [Planctomycetaceae bacterium]|nr:redoxin domain-containing protein [Planctomycetaceae bacterium]
EKQQTSIDEFVALQPVQGFLLADQHSRPVNLDRYLHRHTVVLVFFDGTTAPDDVPELQVIRQYYPALQSEGIEVFAVTNQLPQQIRKGSAQEYPFRILSDVLAGQAGSPMTQWGVVQEVRGGVQPGIAAASSRLSAVPTRVFVISRAGLVPFRDGRPVPLRDTTELVKQLLSAV